jgi:hypothetical protein
MENSNSTNSQGSPNATGPNDKGFSPWQKLKGKRIAYLTLPLLVMATVTECVILATGWKYQQAVCVPKGMGVTLFGIGPIGATILAVELLKLPLAIWTASRQGWQKRFMLFFGLPLICVLTFQLVKDMAVYEMGVALNPASQMLAKANEQEVKIVQLNNELKAIEQKHTGRDTKLAELAAKQTKAKADLAELVKRNEEARQDAISLTDYQKKELSEVDSRENTLIRQFNADTEQLNKTLADLRARREIELTRANAWNVQEARIDNAYKAKLAEYTNKKTAYEKDLAEYKSANFLKRQVLKEPVNPGVPPVREENSILKPVQLVEIDAQIKSKETELTAVNNKRRDQVAQIEADARRLRESFDTRSGTKREEADRKREELSAAQTALVARGAAETKQINDEYDAAAGKVDAIRSELADCRKQAESDYEARETAIKGTQVHRIATTVEIVRGLLFGKHPISIMSTAKERGDLYTDQISMVRIWVYPILAFIVAFLPTLMVEIGFSTIFVPEKQRPAYRIGFFGQGLHWLYIRAGRQKILRAERLAKESAGEVAARGKALAAVRADLEKALAEKEAALQDAHAVNSAAAAQLAERSKRKEAEYAAQLKNKEEEWVAKLASMADSLNRTVIEKDALKDLQKSEIERQIQMRQNAWSDRLTQTRQELDDQRAASETERTAMMQAHQKKLLEISEDCKTQVIQARRQAADAELAAVDATAKLTHDLKEAVHARDAAEFQLQQQADTFSLKLSQAKEDAAREFEKVARQEKHRFDRQQLEFTKTLSQREEAFQHQLNQREQELALGFDARLAEKQIRIEQEARRREAEIERQAETRALEVDARWKQEVQQRDEAAQARLKQREQQLQAQTEAKVGEVQSQADQELRRRESEFERLFESQAREMDARYKQESQQKEITFQAKLKQRELESTAKAEAREAELQTQWAADLRAREQQWEIQAETRVRECETRLTVEAQQREQIASAKAKQREQELTAQLAAEAVARQKAAQERWESDTQIMVRSAIEPLKTRVAVTEKERDEARQASIEKARELQHLEKKLTEASSFLNGWKNGNTLIGAT